MRLTKKDVPFEWTPECTEAVCKLKRAITAKPVLRQPDHNKPFTMEVDTSQYALGAILSQKDEQGKLRPVGYYSKTLIPAECNYDVYDRELLALVRALQHWRHLLLRAEHPIEVFMDHNNLTKYRHAQKLSRHVAQYLPLIAEYNIQLKHKPGAANHADTLSRPPGMDEGSQDNQDIVVLPDHLFCHALELDNLERRVQWAQSEKTFQMEEWKEKYGLIMDNGTWMLRPSTRRSRCRISVSRAFVENEGT